jgi:hypothetical protein
MMIPLCAALSVPILGIAAPMLDSPPRPGVGLLASGSVQHDFVVAIVRGHTCGPWRSTLTSDLRTKTAHWLCRFNCGPPKRRWAGSAPRSDADGR